MKYVDRIIRYISGEMEVGERTEFEKELRTNASLKKELDEVKLAGQFIDRQLEKKARKEYIAGIEEIVRNRNRESYPGTYQVRLKGPWYYYLAAAASIALITLLIFIIRPAGPLYARFYHPSEDKMLASFSERTRGEAGEGISSYYNGNYRAAVSSLESVLRKNPGDQLALLYYILAGIGGESRHIDPDLVPSYLPETDSALERAICWYYSLYLVKWGEYEKAQTYLEPLTQAPGYYHSRAKRLIKVLNRRI